MPILKCFSYYQYVEHKYCSLTLVMSFIFSVEVNIVLKEQFTPNENSVTIFWCGCKVGWRFWSFTANNYWSFWLYCSFNCARLILYWVWFLYNNRHHPLAGKQQSLFAAFSMCNFQEFNVLEWHSSNCSSWCADIDCI